MSSSTMQERVQQARRNVETIKKKIEALRMEKNTGDLPRAASSSAIAAAPLSSNIRQRRVLRGHFGKVYAMHWATDNVQLVSASQDGKLIVWNGHTMNKLQSVALRSSWVMTCGFEPTYGKLVASGGLDNICSIHSLAEPTVSRAYKELAGHDGYLSCCRFVNENQLVTSSGDSSCMLWDVERTQCIKSFTEHGGDVMSVSLNPDEPNIFASGSCDSTAKVWDIRSNDGKAVVTFTGHESDVNSVALLANGNTLATGSDDSTARVFDRRCASQISICRNNQILSGITSVAFSKSGRLLFAGYDDYNCFGWDILSSGQNPALSMKQPGSNLAHENRVSCLGVNVAGTALCTGSWDTTLKIWA